MKAMFSSPTIRFMPLFRMHLMATPSIADNRLSTSIVIDSEPTSLDSRLSTSSNDGSIDLNVDNGIDVLVVDDSIRHFSWDPLDRENMQSSRIVKSVQGDAKDVSDQPRRRRWNPRDSGRACYTHDSENP